MMHVAMGWPCAESIAYPLVTAGNRRRFRTPGMALGESGKGKVLVTSTGRVLVKVEATNGPLHIGDLLVTSELP